MATWAGYPASYTKGRNRPIQYVVIHSTEGSEGTQSAEAGVAYDKRRTDGTSTHLFVDTDTALREVPDADRAHHGRFHGNEIGIGIELCGRAGQTDAQWHDASSLPMLKLAAKEVAAICRAHALPVRRLSVAQVRAAYYAPASARPKGICGHIDLTRAYPEDDGSHTDPGPSFPWTEFLAMVQAEMEDDMPLTTDDLVKIWTHDLQDGPEVEKAYLMMKRAADDASAAKAGVDQILALLQAGGVAGMTPHTHPIGDTGAADPTT
jgi:N-acetyl-anhydromuramyl-L-alanine amidase AmpD